MKIKTENERKSETKNYGKIHATQTQIKSYKLRENPWKCKVEFICSVGEQIGFSKHVLSLVGNL